MASSIVSLQDGWKRIKDDGILVLEDFLDNGHIRESVKQPSEAGKPKRIFSNADFTELYTIVYNMCTQRAPNNWSEQLYKKYAETMTSYIKKRVLPILEKKCGIDLLKELAKAWSNHQLYVKWMTRFFSYLDRYITSPH